MLSNIYHLHVTICDTGLISNWKKQFANLHFVRLSNINLHNLIKVGTSNLHIFVLRKIHKFPFALAIACVQVICFRIWNICLNNTFSRELRDVIFKRQCICNCATLAAAHSLSFFQAVARTGLRYLWKHYSKTSPISLKSILVRCSITLKKKLI